MAITTEIYGSLEEAGAYFANRLHETAWSAASEADRRKALMAARSGIDSLSFKGSKHCVDQPLEFPRGDDTEVPEAIRIAEYENAYALLDGKDPELELENLAMSSVAYGSVKTAYERSQLPIEHVINLCPSSTAWRLLKPFLRDSESIQLSRVS